MATACRGAAVWRIVSPRRHSLLKVKGLNLPPAGVSPNLLFLREVDAAPCVLRELGCVVLRRHSCSGSTRKPRGLREFFLPLDGRGTNSSVLRPLLD